MKRTLIIGSLFFVALSCSRTPKAELSTSPRGSLESLPLFCPDGCVLPCSSDSDCLGDCLCACESEQCSIDPHFSMEDGTPDGKCFSKRARIAGRVRIRTDAGWRLEYDDWVDAGAWYDYHP